MKIFKLLVNDNDDTGMDAISLVEHPAVEVDFLAFDKMELITFSDEKREITGPVCLADTPIYRFNMSLGDHYIIFTKDVIKSMMLKYFKNNLNNQVNIEHEGDMITGLTMIESYIKDSGRNVSPNEFKDIPDGSWIATFKVENDEVWNDIKKLKSLKGFSLQGLFQYGDEVVDSPKKEEEQSYDEWLDELLK